VGRKVIIRSDGRPTQVLRKYIKGPLKRRFFSFPLKGQLFRIIEEINYRLADVVLTECKFMIIDNNFQLYNSKVANLFVDIKVFICKKQLHERKYDIGFVGRLSLEKGILNFIEALKLLNRKFSVVIVGDGEEADRVSSEVLSLRQRGWNVKLAGWVEHSELPSYLNDIKVVVVPSHKEGLPNIVLESIVCGCVVLATSVGGIPGIIRDGETGFIMEDNSPVCIARNILRVLSHPKIEEISENARTLIKNEYAYEATVKRYEEILSEIETNQSRS
jgi:glycosyltransferase involved in cell wall biosynthesis